jgi:hypothetical protein
VDIGRRPRSTWQAIRRRPLLSIALALLLGFVALNVLAYRHARAMLTFDSAAAERTATPERLS